LPSIVALVKADHRAGLTAVPCWVREMSDDDAFMALVLSNAQSELSALERGMHALLATEKGSKLGLSVAAYAEKVGIGRDTIKQWVWAAEVAGAVGTCVPTSDLDRPDRPLARHLAEIHAAPSPAWPALVKHLLAAGWTVKATQEVVRKVRDIVVPEGWTEAFPAEKVVEGVVRPKKKS
jgi:ParB-like chromosome segregation protein Spo0J